MTNPAREELLDLLDRRAFDPVLEASPDGYPEGKRDQLRDVQKTTLSTKESYHRYGSAEKVREMFRDDLHSDAARKTQKQIEQLGLPTLQDVRDEFEKTAERVGVGS